MIRDLPRPSAHAMQHLDAMSDVTRSVKEGVLFGILAGGIFAVAEILATWIDGGAVLLMLRRVGSVLLGPSALLSSAAVTVVIVGIIGHAYLSAMYGLLYGIYNSALTQETRSSPARQAVLGALYGGMLWAANFFVFVPYHYPWLLSGAAKPQLAFHVLAYGVPLGLLYGLAEHRAEPTPAPAR